MEILWAASWSTDETWGPHTLRVTTLNILESPEKSVDSKFDQDSLFFFLCVESTQALEGRSTLWHNAQMVTFRQGFLQRLKAEPPSPHLLPSNLAGARINRINTKEGTMQHPCTLLDDRWPCSGADTTPLPCKPTYTGLKTNQTLASTVLQCNKKHLLQPLGALVPVLRPWDGPAPPEATRKVSVAAGSDRRHAPCWAQHKQLWGRCCWGRWAGMPDLMIYLCLF